MSFPNASHPASPVPRFEASLHRLDGAQALACVEALTDVLIDCVEGGASVSFMRPLTRERAGARIPRLGKVAQKRTSRKKPAAGATGRPCAMNLAQRQEPAADCRNCLDYGQQCEKCRGIGTMRESGRAPAQCGPVGHGPASTPRCMRRAGGNRTRR